MGGIYSKISNNKKEKDLIKNLQNLQVRVIAYLISKGIMSDDLVEEFAKYYSNTIKDEFNLKDIYNERNIIEEANTLSRRILEQNANDADIVGDSNIGPDARVGMLSWLTIFFNFHKWSNFYYILLLHHLVIHYFLVKRENERLKRF